MQRSVHRPGGTEWEAELLPVELFTRTSADVFGRYGARGGRGDGWEQYGAGKVCLCNLSGGVRTVAGWNCCGISFLLCVILDRARIVWCPNYQKELD